MKISFPMILSVGVMVMASSVASAGQYQCKVYCVGPSGSTSVTIRADSASQAASIADKTGDQICRAAGHRGATSQSMSSSQCR